ncbi:MAG: metallophosphoesterase, partial [Candidatus Omnitrophica bacterium]|nr:metallophosphoesterase [Candidatus Omnitrophota bacterium]
ELEKNKMPYFSFIVVSDTSSGLFLNEAATLKIIRTMNREDRFRKIPIDFVINVGDVTFRGRESHYKNYRKMMSRLKFPVITAIGNHDDDIDNGKEGERLFTNYCGDREFTFVDRNSFFIVLDNRDGSFSEHQFEWFEEKLKSAQSYEHTFVFLHKPPFNPVQQSWYRIETCPWSHRFMKLCEKYRVDIVFSGHEYSQVSEEFGGVKYVISGGGGTLLTAPSWERSFLNYISVKVNHDYVGYEVRRVMPPVWEFFTYYMWKDLIFFVRDLLS